MHKQYETYPHKNSYPTEFKVKNTKIKVRFSSLISNDSATIGLYDPNNKTITLREGLHGELLATTFIHEVLHAIEDVCKIRVKHSLVHKLELPITQVMYNLFGFIFKQ